MSKLNTYSFLITFSIFRFRQSTAVLCAFCIICMKWIYQNGVCIYCSFHRVSVFIAITYNIL